MMVCVVVFTYIDIPYSRKLSRKKTFTNFAVLWLFAKVFYAKFGGVSSFGAAQSSNPRKFSPAKVSRYMVACKAEYSLLPRQQIKMIC